MSLASHGRRGILGARGVFEDEIGPPERQAGFFRPLYTWTAPSDQLPALLSGR